MPRSLKYFAGKSQLDARTKNDKRVRRYRLESPLSIATALLPSGERLPLLVRSETGLPLSLAMRWAVFERRLRCAPNTLKGDLYALRYLYAWGDAHFPMGLEARLEYGAPLSRSDVLSLREFLERPADPSILARPRDGDETGGSDFLAQVGRRALVAKQFLSWAVDPASRNQRGAPPKDADALRSLFESVLQPIAKHAGHGGIGAALDEETALRGDALISPLTTDSGEFLRPLRWHAENPFRSGSRLRNWLLWSLTRDTGFRIGESLAMYATDFTVVRGTKCAAVIFRSPSPAETRVNVPRPKTRERVVPVGPHTEFALRAYMTERPPLGRHRSSPFLFTSRSGRPLSISSASEITQRLSPPLGASVSWHDLRHTWATELARGALAGAIDGSTIPPESAVVRALLIEQLRELGGWSEESNMPMRYARAAIKEYTDAGMRRRQNERVERMLAYRLRHIRHD